MTATQVLKARGENDAALRLQPSDAGQLSALLEVELPSGIIVPVVDSVGGGENRFAESLGLKAWTNDPSLSVQQAVDTTGSIHGSCVYLEAGKVITGLAILVAVAPVTMTHGAYAIGDAAGNILAQTADNPGAFAVTNAWVPLPLTAPYTVPVSGMYYFLDLLAASGTMPTIANTGSLATTSGRNQVPISNKFRNVNCTGGPFAVFPGAVVYGGTGISRCIVAY